MKTKFENQISTFYRCYDRTAGKFLPLTGACTVGQLYDFLCYDDADKNLDRWCKKLPDTHILTIVKVTRKDELEDMFDD